MFENRFDEISSNSTNPSSPNNPLSLNPLSLYIYICTRFEGDVLMYHVAAEMRVSINRSNSEI